MIKKFGLLIFVITFYISGYSQQTPSLSDFLDRDLTQILQDHIDSLSRELFFKNTQLNNSRYKFSALNNAAVESASFLLLLHKLEDNLPLNGADSAMINVYTASDQSTIIKIRINVYALNLITDNDSLYMDNFPKLAKMVKEEKLIIESFIISAMEAPAVEMPPTPTSTGSNKKLIAQAWLNYIYELSDKCEGGMSQFNTYQKKEKTKVPDGNLINIIKLRQKFALFIIENYCKK